MSGFVKVSVEASQFTVSALPSDHPDYHAFVITVDRRIQRDGSALWSVSHMGCVLHISEDHWDHEPQPSSRDAKWIANHRWHDVRAATRAARRAALNMVDGFTAADRVRP